MKKILLLATGGTIASRPTAAGGLAPAITSEELLACVPELADLCKVSAVQVFNLDSTNVGPAQWQSIVRCIKENYDACDGFVIAHGTDTMAYTAAALSYMVQNSAKPVVLTGSQKSIYNRDTDARNNLYRAFVYAVSDGAWGVQLVFDNKVILGTRARKTRTRSFNAFSSIDYPETAMFRDRRLIQFLQRPVRLVQQVDDVRGHDRVKAPVRVVELRDIRLREPHVAAVCILSFCLREHLLRKIRRRQRPAPRCDHTGQQTRAAGTFQHLVLRPDVRRHRRAHRPVRPPVDPVRKHIIHPSHPIPKHRVSSRT